MVNIILSLILGLSLVPKVAANDCELMKAIRYQNINLLEFHQVTFSVKNSCDPRLLHPLWLKALTKNLDDEELQILLNKICGSGFTPNTAFSKCNYHTISEDVEHVLMLEENNPATALTLIEHYRTQRIESQKVTFKVLSYLLRRDK